MQRFVNERPAELPNAVVTAAGGRIEGFAKSMLG
jgi:hypothetical protein